MKYVSRRPDLRGNRRLADERNPILDGSEYTADEVEFMLAMDRYKRHNRRPFPTWQEVYGVFRSLGYTKCQNGRPDNTTADSRKDRASPSVMTNYRSRSGRSRGTGS